MIFSSESLYNDLVAHKLIIPVGVQGIFGRGAVFEDVLARLLDGGGIGLGLLLSGTSPGHDGAAGQSFSLLQEVGERLKLLVLEGTELGAEVLQFSGYRGGARGTKKPTQVRNEHQ